MTTEQIENSLSPDDDRLPTSSTSSSPIGDEDSTTQPVVIAQLPPCPDWCTDHPYADDALQVHEAVIASGNWFENELPESGNLARGGVRLRQSEYFEFEARAVTRDAAVTVELFTLAPEGEQYRISAYMSIVSPRAVAAALLAVADVIDAQ
jgi:hypothetical protein